MKFHTSILLLCFLGFFERSATALECSNKTLQFCLDYLSKDGLDIEHIDDDLPTWNGTVITLQDRCRTFDKFTECMNGVTENCAARKYAGWIDAYEYLCKKSNLTLVVDYLECYTSPAVVNSVDSLCKRVFDFKSKDLLNGSMTVPIDKMKDYCKLADNFFGCLNKTLTVNCGEEAAKWQWNWDRTLSMPILKTCPGWISTGCCCLMEVVDGANEFRRCYKTSVEMHCFDAQYDTANNKWLTASFDNARQRCNDLQSTLIIIKDEETNEKLQEFMKDTDNPIRSNDVWLDAYRFNDFNVTNRWQWFNKTLPNLSASGVFYTPDSTWYVAALEFNSNSFYLKAQPPHVSNSYICEYSVSTCPSVDSSNFRQFDGKCYTAVNDSVNWYEARNRCLKGGGDLASFANVSSIDFTSWLGSDSNIQYWIGLRFGGYIWKDSGEDVKFAKWIPNYGDWDSRCLAVCPTCYPRFSWYAKNCTITDSIHVVCHTATSFETPTTSTTSAIMQSTRSAADSTSAGTFKTAKDTGLSSSDSTSVGIGLGVGLGVPFVIVTVLVIILAVKYKRLATRLEQRPRNDNNELAAVHQPSAGQANESDNNQYQQLNRNVDNSSGTMYDKLRVEPEQNYEEVPSSRT